MSEIPLDIRNSAEALTKPALVSLLNHPVSTAQSLVMKAVLAERERCAKIASGVKWEAKPGANPRNVEVLTKIVTDTGLRIAAAIRGEA